MRTRSSKCIVTKLRIAGARIKRGRTSTSTTNGFNVANDTGDDLIQMHGGGTSNIGAT
jgi:hypothetical protein